MLEVARAVAVCRPVLGPLYLPVASGANVCGYYFAHMTAEHMG